MFALQATSSLAAKLGSSREVRCAPRRAKANVPGKGATFARTHTPAAAARLDATPAMRPSCDLWYKSQQWDAAAHQHPRRRGDKQRVADSSGRGPNPNSDSVDFELDGGTSALLIFAFVAFQFFVLAFVDFPSFQQLKGH